jgi:hypothetical protein
MGLGHAVALREERERCADRDQEGNMTPVCFHRAFYGRMHSIGFGHSVALEREQCAGRERKIMSSFPFFFQNAFYGRMYSMGFGHSVALEAPCRKNKGSNERFEANLNLYQVPFDLY